MKLTIFLGFFILISSEILRAQGNEWEVFTSDNPVLAKIINTNTCQVVMHKDTTTFVMQPLGKGPMTFWKNSQLVLARPGDSIKFRSKKLWIQIRCLCRPLFVHQWSTCKPSNTACGSRWELGRSRMARNTHRESNAGKNGQSHYPVSFQCT